MDDGYIPEQTVQCTVYIANENQPVHCCSRVVVAGVAKIPPKIQINCCQKIAAKKCCKKSFN